MPVRRAGTVLGPIGDPNLGNTPVLSPDERQIAFPRQDDGNTDVWLLDLARGIRRRFTTDPALDSHPLWSPTEHRSSFNDFGTRAVTSISSRPPTMSPRSACS